jgi:hypothetical protein
MGMTIRALYLVALIPALAAGWSVMPASMRRSLATPYAPANVSVRQPTMPQTIRRVAVLPLPQSREDANQAAGASLLQPVLIAELAKRNLFDIIPVSPETLRGLTAGNGWAVDAPLPPEFFERLHQLTDCDAVVFASLTVYRPYPPLQTGWKVRLVDCRERQTWWAVDEVFDAGTESVVAAAEHYARVSLSLPNPLLADTGVLHSPLRFGQYTANVVARTLPDR